MKPGLKSQCHPLLGALARERARLAIARICTSSERVCLSAALILTIGGSSQARWLLGYRPLTLLQNHLCLPPRRGLVARKSENMACAGLPSLSPNLKTQLFQEPSPPSSSPLGLTWELVKCSCPLQTHGLGRTCAFPGLSQGCLGTSE